MINIVFYNEYASYSERIIKCTHGPKMQLLFQMTADK